MTSYALLIAWTGRMGGKTFAEGLRYIANRIEEVNEAPKTLSMEWRENTVRIVAIT